MYKLPPWCPVVYVNHNLKCSCVFVITEIVVVCLVQKHEPNRQNQFISLGFEQAQNDCYRLFAHVFQLTRFYGVAHHSIWFVP